MRNLILPPVAVLAVAAAVLAAACTDTAEEAGTTAAPPSETPAATAAADTPTAEPVGETPTATQPPDGAGGGGGGVLVPITTPFASPAPVPEDWATYADPEGRFTVRYPPAWFKREGGSLSSVDPSTAPGNGVPPNSIQIDVGYFTEDDSGCGQLRIDPETGELLFTEAEAAPATVDGVSGGQIVRVFDPPELGLTRIHGFNVIYKGYCFKIAAYFFQDEPDEAMFLQIVSSFRFGDFAAVDEKP